ncbi:MAG TPA: arginase [Thermomicrobiales bacterium]|jgi:arginase|nr:arginase [Thermomicrobiales bacterium]
MMRHDSGKPNRLSDPAVPVDVFRVPMALGANREGVDQGATTLDNALRRRLETRGYTQILGRLQPSVDIPVTPLGPDRGDEPNAWYANEIAAACATLAGGVAETVGAGRFALLLGGDHALAVGSLAGAGVAGRLGVIWVDAHADINTPETSPSGNVHGMPLAAALGQGPRQLAAVGSQSGLRLDDLIYIAVRDLDPGERELLADGPALVWTADDVEIRGIAEIVTASVDRLLANGIDALHLSFDLDALDPTVMPGTGTRVPGGLTYREATRLLALLRRSGLPIVSADVVELNPLLDPSGGSTAVAAAIAGALLGETIL